MLDIHAHLYWDSYDADRDAMIRRAFAVGIEKMICVGTEPKDNPKAVEVAEAYEDVYASIGLHPHFFDEHIKKDFPISQSSKAIEGLRELARHSKVVAIGECGLDYFSRDLERPVTDELKAVQRSGFLAQMEVAAELGLPLIIHTRPSVGTVDAYGDLLLILQTTNTQSLVILHCYQGDTETTKKFLELPNIYFSFAGNITYPMKKASIGTKDDLSEVVKLVPLKRMFIETDAPFLSPQGKRGERNEPAYALATAEKACELKVCTRETLDAVLRANFQTVFIKAEK